MHCSVSHPFTCFQGYNLERFYVGNCFEKIHGSLLVEIVFIGGAIGWPLWVVKDGRVFKCNRSLSEDKRLRFLFFDAIESGLKIQYLGAVLFRSVVRRALRKA